VHQNAFTSFVHLPVLNEPRQIRANKFAVIFRYRRNFIAYETIDSTRSLVIAAIVSQLFVLGTVPVAVYFCVLTPGRPSIADIFMCNSCITIMAINGT
jgi:hypothetical protein